MHDSHVGIMIYKYFLVKITPRRLIFFFRIATQHNNMGGGLLQLVSYGAQDIYISGNPQITFWKVLYKRHTNFAMESIEVTFNGQADFN